MAPRLTEDELAQLTDEEREGYLEDLEEGGETEEDGEAEEESAADDEKTAKAAEDDSDDDEADEADGAAADGKSEKEADPAAAAKQQEQQQAVAQEEEVSAEASEDDDTRPDWILPADFEAKKAELNDKLDELADSFDNGDMTAKELRARERELRDELDAIKAREIEAGIARKSAIKDWVNRDVAGFMADHPEYTKPGFLRDALDAEVKKLQSSSQNPFNPKILQKAHQAIASQIDGAFKVDRQSQVSGDQKAKATSEKQQKALPKRENPPPTLAQIPAAESVDVDDGEFAHLDRMISRGDSIAYEKALAAMPEAKREQYLAQG